MPTETAPCPVVAIVGRPNVGKSAIFNRLLGRRVAIVHAESGVTRDRIVRQAVWNDKRFELVDTGGIANPDDARIADRIASEMRRQAEIAVQDATVVILVVDAIAGVAAMDEDVVRLLRARGARTVVACNKCDAPEHDDNALVFEQFGLPVFAVSALHNRGFEELMDAVTRELPAVAVTTPAHPIRVVVAGRPNVGKSSFINRLLHAERVIVSEVPGTTRDSVDIPYAVGSGPQARHYILTDTAGMRHIRRLTSPVEKFSLFRAETSISGADVVVFMLDAVDGPTEQDKKVASLILEKRRGCLIAVNKWDQVKGVTRKVYEEALRRELPFLDYAPVVFMSALTGFNVRQAMDAIDHVSAQVRATLPTGVLNRAIMDAYERTQPPMVSGKRLKAFYATQVGTQPLRILLFVNDPKRLVPAYERYLIKAVRSAFGLEGAPVLFELRKKN